MAHLVMIMPCGAHQEHVGLPSDRAGTPKAERPQLLDGHSQHPLGPHKPSAATALTPDEADSDLGLEIMTITPELAQEWLDRGGTNRKITRPRMVAKWSQRRVVDRSGQGTSWRALRSAEEPLQAVAQGAEPPAPEAMTAAMLRRGW